MATPAAWRRTNLAVLSRSVYRSRADRFVTLVATDVVSQGRDRRVALRCVLLQGLRDDRIEVSTKRAAKPDRGGAALGRMAGHGLPGGDPVNGSGHARRLGFDDRADERGARADRLTSRMLTAQQHVQEHAESVDIRRSRHGATRQLLWCRVLGRHRPPDLARHRTAFRRVSVVSVRTWFDQLGDAEVEQLHVPIHADEHVGRLDVAVNDQIGVCMRNGFQHVQKKTKARLDAERTLFTKVDRCTGRRRARARGTAGRS